MISMRLSPGVAIAPIILASTDRDGDGVISEAEGRDYVERLRQELFLSWNGENLPLRATSTQFATTEAMLEGVGEIHLEWIAQVPRPSPTDQSLHFENRHLPAISAYLVNALAPSDAHTVIASQTRNFTQSRYRMDYSRARSIPSHRAWLLGLGLLLATRLFFVWRRA